MKKKSSKPIQPVQKEEVYKIPRSKVILAAAFFVFLLLCLGVLLSSFSQKSNETTANKPVETATPVKNDISLAKNATNSASPSAKKNEVVAYTPQYSGNQIQIPVLMYHYIGNNPNPADTQRDVLSVTPDKFEEQMKYLSDSGYATTSLDTLYAALKKQVTLPNKSIILTFDDGYIDFYYNAYPILRRFGFSATVFIPTGLMGQGAYLTWDQIKEMHASGFISFGAHTVHHYSLPYLSRETALFELKESKKVLQDQLGVPINFMAYPFGSTNGSVNELAKEAGFAGSAGTWLGKIQSEGTIYNMPRIRINGTVSFNTFKGLL